MMNTVDASVGCELTASAPLWDQAEFDKLVAGLVNDFAPRLFAVVQELGTRQDGRIAAWGMAFDDHAEIVAVDGGTRLTLSTAERAITWFNRPRDVTARLVWVGSLPETSPQT